MADSFDPYHKWLGISAKDQPPNHYRLLGIELFESDPDVIEGAADQRMSHVRTFQTGQNSALSQRILNELSAAKICLLDPQKKAEYDRQLQAKLLSASVRPAPVAAPLPVTEPLAVAQPLPVSEPAPLFSVASAAPAVIARRAAPKKPAWQQPMILGAAGGAVVLLTAIIYFLTAGSKPSVAQREGENAKPGIPKASALVEPTKSAVPQPNKIAATPTKASAEIKPSTLITAPDKPDFAILDAAWGIGDKWVNVTDAVRRLVKDHRLVTMVWSNLFGSPQDPAPNVAKNLRIRYRARGREFTVEYPDYFFIYLDGNPLAAPTESPDALELLEARYGAGDKSYIDVLPQARKRVRDGYFSAAADDFYQKDVIPEGWKADQWAGTYKLLWVRYRNATGEHFAYAWNSQRLTIDCRTPQTAGPPVDLLKQIDIGRDAVQGKWTLNSDLLTAPGGMYDRLLLPADVPDEYVWTMIVQADGELRDVSAGLAIGGRQTICCIDGAKGLSTGLNLVNDAWFSQAERNPTFNWRMSRLLEQGRPNTLTYIVRKTSLQLLRDGVELVRWSGDPQTLSLPDRGYVPNPRRIFIQSYDMPYHVSKLELAPLAPAKSEVLTRLEPGKPVDALKAVDLDRDLVHGHWEFDGQSLVSPDNDRGRMQIPVVLPEEYRLDVIAARESGGDCLSFTLPVGGVQTDLLIDGYQGKLAGLQAIDGKHIDINETRREGSMFADGKPKAISITISKHRVQMVCDGQSLVDWSGDVSRLTPTEELPYKDRVYLGDWFSRYRITKFEVTSLTGDSEPAPAAASKPIDLLSAVDLEKDAVAGTWKKTDGALITPEEEFSRLMLPAPPSSEYQVTVVAEREKGNWGLAVGLVVDGRQVMADIDGYDGHHSGLDDIDGKACNNNETTRTGRLLVDGKPSTLVYTVRRNSVQVSLDGRTIIDWHGDPKRLSMIEEWKIPDPTRLSLNTFKTVCRISKIEVAPLARSESPSVIAGGPIDVLKQIDLKRDVQFGEWRMEGSALLAPATPNSRLQAPVVPPDEYQLTLVAKGEPITRDIVFVLPIAGRQALLVLDGWLGTPSALLKLVNGKPEANNETTVNHRVLADGENEIVCTVRKTSIEVKCNGKRVIDWSGDPATLVNDRDVPSAKHLYLYSWSTPYRVSKFEIAPLAPSKSAGAVAGEPIDVLKQIDVKRHAVAGDWTTADGALVSPDAPFSKLLLPAPPSPEYQVTIVGQKVKGSYGLGVALVIGGRQVLADIDGVDGTYTGVSLVDGKNPRDSGEGRHGRLLTDGKEATFVYTVRRNSIRVTLDGRTVIDWRGEPSRLSMVEGYTLPDTTRLALCEYETVLRISKIEFAPLTPQSGSASASARSPDPAKQPMPPIAGSASRPRSLGGLVAGDASRLPPPDDAAQKKARQDIQKTFGSDLAAAKTVQEKRQLAEKFVKLAAEPHEDNATVYVLLRQAADLAEAAGDLDLAWQAIDELAKRYSIDAISLEHQSLTELGKAAKSPQEVGELARAACRLLAAALAAEQPSAVKKIAAQAQSFAKRAKDASLVKEVGLRTRDASKLAAEFEMANAAREKLKKEPDDAGANFTLGRYELCAKDDWKQALPWLAKGSEATWQKLAKDELELARDPATPAQQLALGDGWWTLAEKEAWPGRHYLRIRAAEWYRLARPSLAAKDQTHVSARLKTLLAVDDGLPAWDLFDIQRGQKADGYVRLNRGGAVRTAIEYGGPMEVAFEARTDGKNIRLFAHNREAVIWNWELNPRELRVARPDGELRIAKVVPLEPNRWYSFRYAITPQGMGITVDGESVFTESHSYGNFPSSPVGVMSGQDSVVDVKNLVVKPL